MSPAAARSRYPVPAGRYGERPGSLADRSALLFLGLIALLTVSDLVQAAHRLPPYICEVHTRCSTTRVPAVVPPEVLTERRDSAGTLALSPPVLPPP
ncbi:MULTISPECIES: hypothetical protein [unclassified Streptomyces]|uniref:hypothetical protein n=1 Tax=unclassified Streptomyces TaxID=2593676 RepID=UPI001F0374BA|nr:MULTISPECIES: hypothetical protein [unclassified Streptomyces]MCH0564618.1 hypothetical protein [Streptomyces sp. MUM 2J]MCH0573322.1 hypothetical protein [Streptomyces sp. MUM 136J]